MKKTQRGLVRDFAKTLNQGQLVLRTDVIAWVKARFHGAGTRISQSVDGMTVNHEKRMNREFGKNELADVYYRIGSGKNAKLRLYLDGDKPFYPVTRR